MFYILCSGFSVLSKSEESILTKFEKAKVGQNGTKVPEYGSNFCLI